jgi:hypothetical protein
MPSLSETGWFRRGQEVNLDFNAHRPSDGVRAFAADLKTLPPLIANIASKDLEANPYDEWEEVDKEKLIKAGVSEPDAEKLAELVHGNVSFRKGGWVVNGVKVIVKAEQGRYHESTREEPMIYIINAGPEHKYQRDTTKEPDYKRLLV